MGTARVRSDARSDPAPGSLNSWHQISSALRMRGSQRAFCRVGAVRQDRRPHVVDAVAVHRLRRPGTGVLHVEDGHLQRGRPPPAVLGRPVDAHPAVCGQTGLPFAPPFELVVQRVKAIRELDIGFEPAADLVAEGLFLRSQCEIHGALYRGSGGPSDQPAMLRVAARALSAVRSGFPAASKGTSSSCTTSSAS